jgi:hypothetical protein
VHVWPQLVLASHVMVFAHVQLVCQTSFEQQTPWPEGHDASPAQAKRVLAG